MSVDPMDKAVILAGGLGTRMQKTSPDAQLSRQQAAVADTGIKGLIPIDRPFLDYVLTAVADAGYRRVCLVVGPAHDAIHTYYGQTVTPRRITIEFATQQEPLGTANAVAAAETFAGEDPFLVINSDNHYPPEALRLLRDLDGCGLIAFEREGLFEGNIPPDRVARFAILQISDSGDLTRILEKPTPEQIAQQPEPVCVSMNCWRFDPDIFKACRAIDPSPRGEYEVPDAAQYAIDTLAKPFRTLPFSAPVLDLTSRSDVAGVTEGLAGLTVDF